MADKYLSIITNFGCHYKCPECVVRNNGLQMSKTKENSCIDGLARAAIQADANWVSVSGGGDPLFNWQKHQIWWRDFFMVCRYCGLKAELHTSYFNGAINGMMVLFPFCRFDRVVYHVHTIVDLKYVHRFGHEIVRVVFVVSDNMTENDVEKIADFVEWSNEIDELSFRQRIDSYYVTTYHLHDFLQAGHKKRWWYITQNDYNTYYHNGKLFSKYTDIFDKKKEI